MDSQEDSSREAFLKPADMIGTFAVVKLWPGIKVAEDEVIARLKIAAQVLGLSCIEISPEGKRIDLPGISVTKEDVDFVIHLHCETPKTYDIFSFVALWNPLRFYYDYIEGGYRRFSDNLMSHDDFLSCSAPGADDHIRRMMANSPNHLPPCFTMFHSLAKPIIEPALGAMKLFYAGINWERLGKKKSRHQELLDLLDKSGELRIYGPHKLQSVKVWDGYESYMGELPFDGMSVVNEIAAAGVSLVLSSDSHKESGLMSSRLFESLAAGAVIICDENPFARKHFGDTLLYIDGSFSVRATHQQIKNHLRWIKKNPQDALALARRAQDIFKDKFTLDRSIAHIYRNFAERKRELARLRAPAATPPVTLFMLMPTFEKATLSQHIASARAQTYQNVKFILLVDRYVHGNFARLLQKQIQGADVNIDLRPVDYFVRDDHDDIVKRNPLGKIIYEQICGLDSDSYVGFVGQREALFGDHVDVLVKALTDRNAVGADRAEAAHADTLLKTRNGEATTYETQCAQLEVFGYTHRIPSGSGCFLFKKPANTEALACVLPYLGIKALSLLAAQGNVVGAGKATLIAEINATAQEEDAKDADFNDKIMCDFLPPATIEKYKLSNQAVKADILASLQNMPPSARAALIRELFFSLPLSKSVQKFVLFCYRRVRRLPRA